MCCMFCFQRCLEVQGVATENNYSVFVCTVLEHMSVDRSLTLHPFELAESICNCHGSGVTVMSVVRKTVVSSYVPEQRLASDK